MNASKKRAAESDEDERVVDSKGSHGTRQVRSSEDVAQPSSKPGPNVKRSSAQSGAKRKKRAADPTAGGSEVNEKHAEKPKHRIKKLVPPRPFPTVPTSVSATGPRSAHKEGKNYICLTRKTPLGVYLRRCKEVIVKDGYKTLHLSAMGAAIPHLSTLAVSLPSILPFAADEIHTEILTGSVEVQDEVIPEDEDEDISYQTRGKSTLSVLITIGDGDDEAQPIISNNVKGKTGSKIANHAGGKKKGQSEQIVLQEPEQDDMYIQ